MNWTPSVIALLVVVTIYSIWKRATQISTKRAVAYLRGGALVIDVRSSAEFSAGHLLHCQSGMRSGMAKTKLGVLGYANAFNLGSYGRAARIVSAS